MMRLARARRGLIALSALGLAVMACNLQVGAPADAPVGTPGSLTPTLTAEVEASATQSLTATLTPTPEFTLTATATEGPPPLITVSAVGGRLNLRRGPGPEYDTVGALLDGQSRTALARNADGTWLRITGQNSPTGAGWVIMTTKYTSVTGSVEVLPVETVSPAAPAYIRNCTPHEMLVNPTGVVLPSRSSAPENELQFFPGEYAAIDQTTEAEVASITVFEGRTIDIRKDSSGTSYTCP